MRTDPRLSAEERKRLLVLQGQVFRSGLTLAQHDVRAGLEPRKLMRAAFGEAVESGADAARKLLTLQSLLDGRLAMFLPIAGKGVRLLSRTGLLRPLALALAAGGIGYLGWKVWQHKRATESRAAPGESDLEASKAQ